MMIKFYLKKYTIGLALLLFSTATFANAFLLGIQVTQTLRVGEFRTDYIAPTFNINTTNTLELNIKDNGTSIGGLVGYEHELNRWLLGIEANIEELNRYEKPRGFHSVASNGTNIPGVVRYNNGALLALSGRVGYKIDPHFLPYLRVGAHTSEDDFVYIPTPQGNVQNTDVNRTQERVYGWRAGLGLEVTCFSPTVLRFEYNYAKTERMSIIDTAGNLTGTHSFKPHFHSGTVAWVWKI